MRAEPMLYRGMSVGDLQTFLVVTEQGSLQQAADSLRVSRSQVSKSIRRLEGQLRRPLLVRSGRKAVLSEAGRRAVPHVSRVTAELAKLHASMADTLRVLTVAAPERLLAACVPALSQMLPGTQLITVAAPNERVTLLALREQIDAALCFGRPRLPSAWETEEVAHVRSALYGSPQLAQTLGKFPLAPEQLAGQRFVGISFYDEGKAMEVQDGCPLLPEDRGHGVKTSNLELAFTLAAQTHQLVFGPTLLAASHVNAGTLVEIPVRGWSSMTELLLCYQTDRVRAREREALLSVARAMMGADEREARA